MFKTNVLFLSNISHEKVFASQKAILWIAFCFENCTDFPNAFTEISSVMDSIWFIKLEKDQVILKEKMCIYILWIYKA